MRYRFCGPAVRCGGGGGEGGEGEEGESSRSSRNRRGGGGTGSSDSSEQGETSGMRGRGAESQLGAGHLERPRDVVGQVWGWEGGGVGCGGWMCRARCAG